MPGGARHPERRSKSSSASTNIVFISVLVSRCSPEDAKRARQNRARARAGLRIILLLGLTWLMKADLSGRQHARPRLLSARHHPDSSVACS